MTDLAPRIRIGEIPPKVRNIQGVSTSFIATVGVFAKGPIGVPTFISGQDEFIRVFGAPNALGVSALTFDKFFKNGGGSGFFVRTAHYSDPSDPNTLTAIKAFKMLDDRRPDAGIKAKGTAKLDANTLVSWVQASGFVEILDNTFDAGDIVTINGVNFEQGVDFTPGIDAAATALALLAAINGSANVAIDGVLTAAIDPSNSSRVILTAVAYGVSGNAITLAETDNATDNFGLSGAVFTGGIDGDSITVGALVVNVGEDFTPGATIALTIAALVAYVDANSVEVNAAVDGEDETNATALFTALLVGVAGNSLALTAVDTNASLTLSGATLTGGQATDAESSLLVTADDGEGEHANGRIIRIDDATNGLATHYNLLVVENGLVVDIFPNLNHDVNSVNYVETRVNGKQLKKIRVVDQLSSNTANNENLPEVGDHILAGGNNGLVGLTDFDFIGTEAAQTGMYAWDFIEDKFAMASVPERTTVAVQKFGPERAEMKKHYLFFNDLPSGMSPQQALDFVDQNGLRNEYGTHHYPSLRVSDLDPANLGNEKIIPNSAAIMGMYARTDNQPGKGVAKTAAGINDGRIFDIIGFENDPNTVRGEGTGEPYTQKEGNRNLLFPGFINPLWSEQGVGPINDGGRLSSSTGLVRNVNERRVFIYAETSIKLGIRFAKHENIDLTLFNALNSSITAFLTRFWRQGGLKGRVSSEAFSVNTESGPGTINPPSEAEAERLTVEVGLATKKPGYFIDVNFTVDQRQLLNELAAA